MKHSDSPKNLTGIERAISVVGGLALLGNGMRTRGLGGIVQIATGGLALLRGTTGHCELKQLMAEKCRSGSANVERYSHMPLDSDVRSPDLTGASHSQVDSSPAGRRAPLVQS